MRMLEFIWQKCEKRPDNKWNFSGNLVLDYKMGVHLYISLNQMELYPQEIHS